MVVEKLKQNRFLPYFEIKLCVHYYRTRLSPPLSFAVVAKGYTIPKTKNCLLPRSCTLSRSLYLGHVGVCRLLNAHIPSRNPDAVGITCRLAASSLLQIMHVFLLHQSSR